MQSFAFCAIYLPFIQCTFLFPYKCINNSSIQIGEEQMDAYRNFSVASYMFAYYAARATDQEAETRSLGEGAIDEAYLGAFRAGTMYMNRYNFERALALFGAVEDFGAQAIQPETNVRTGRR